MKTYTLDQVQDKLIGTIGTPARDIFEQELHLDLIGKAMQQAHDKRSLPTTLILNKISDFN
jgi:hypothetical protein